MSAGPKAGKTGNCEKVKHPGKFGVVKDHGVMKPPPTPIKREVDRGKNLPLKK